MVLPLHKQSATETVTSFREAGTGYCTVIAGQTTVTTAHLHLVSSHTNQMITDDSRSDIYGLHQFSGRWQGGSLRCSRAKSMALLNTFSTSRA